jgi:hypothetical protein
MIYFMANEIARKILDICDIQEQVNDHYTALMQDAITGKLSAEDRDLATYKNASRMNGRESIEEIRDLFDRARFIYHETLPGGRGDKNWPNQFIHDFSTKYLNHFRTSHTCPGIGYLCDLPLAEYLSERTRDVYGKALTIQSDLLSPEFKKYFNPATTRIEAEFDGIQNIVVKLPDNADPSQLALKVVTASGETMFNLPMSRLQPFGNDLLISPHAYAESISDPSDTMNISGVSTPTGLGTWTPKTVGTESGLSESIQRAFSGGHASSSVNEQAQELFNLLTPQIETLIDHRIKGHRGKQPSNAAENRYDQGTQGLLSRYRQDPNSTVRPEGTAIGLIQTGPHALEQLAKMYEGDQEQQFNKTHPSSKWSRQ